MTREEKIAKLRTIKLIIPELMVSYDMGLMYEIYTSEGIDGEMTDASWPISKVKVTPALRRLHAKVVDGQPVTLKDFTRLKLFRSLLTHHSTPWSAAARLPEEDATEYEEMAKEALLTLKLSDPYIYSFVGLEDYNREFALFDTYDQLIDFASKKFGEYIRPYDTLSDAEIDKAYRVCEDEGWCNTVPMFES